MQFYETSALNNTNVSNAFMTLVTEIKQRLAAEGPGKTVDAKDEKKKLKGKPKQQASSGCC